MTKRNAIKNAIQTMTQDQARAKLREAFRIGAPEGKYAGRDAAQWRQDSAKQATASYESFERCDTDGFLSQWAHNLNSSLDSRKVDLARRNGKSVFAVVCDKTTGEVVAHKVISGTYGDSYVVRDEHQARLGRKFLPVGANSRVHKQWGLEERMAWADAFAYMGGSGTGLSGTAFVAVRMDRDAQIEPTEYTREALQALVRVAFPAANVQDYDGFCTLLAHVEAGFALEAA